MFYAAFRLYSFVSKVEIALIAERIGMRRPKRAGNKFMRAHLPVGLLLELAQPPGSQKKRHPVGCLLSF